MRHFIFGYVLFLHLLVAVKNSAAYLRETIKKAPLLWISFFFLRHYQSENLNKFASEQALLNYLFPNHYIMV